MNPTWLIDHDGDTWVFNPVFGRYVCIDQNKTDKVLAYSYWFIDSQYGIAQESEVEAEDGA